MTKMYTFGPVDLPVRLPYKIFLSSGEAVWGSLSLALMAVTALFGGVVMAAGACGVYVGFTTDNPSMLVAGITVLVATPCIWKATC